MRNARQVAGSRTGKWVLRPGGGGGEEGGGWMNARRLQFAKSGRNGDVWERERVCSGLNDLLLPGGGGVWGWGVRCWNLRKDC